jgi:hypothetical protein
MAMICKLTGTTGVYVKSHLIPKAVTRPEAPGLPLIQGGSGRRAVRRWDSWYDKGLVTKEGEAILSDLDDWAIRHLRAERLIWSGWGPMTALGSFHNRIPGTPWGVRKVKVDDPKKLRLFFLSLLWRAAASQLHEFSEIDLPASDLDKLAKMIVRQDPDPIDFYPATLTQLSTLGMIHNMAPIAQVKLVPELSDFPDESSGREIPIFRFYFDGLIAHVHRHASDDGHTKRLGDFFVGADRKLTVSTVSYEHSFERENLSYVIAETVYD